MSEPITLALSASRGRYACALRDAGGATSAVGGAADLVTAVDQLCRAAHLAPTDLARLLVDIGPGSYTGLRVAVTFARTLRAFAGVSTDVATSLELLALRAWRRGDAEHEAVVRPILDARRGRFHHAALRLRDVVELNNPPAAVPRDVLCASIAAGEVLLVDATIRDVVADVAAARGCAVQVLPDAATDDLAELLLDPLLRPRRAEEADLTPLYLMGSYADDDR